MSAVSPAAAAVNPAQPHRGQPSKQTPECIRVVNRAVVQALATGTVWPGDEALATQLQLSARTVRAIRLEALGLNYREIKQRQRAARRAPPAPERSARQLVCHTPFAGLCPLVPQLLESGVVKAAEQLKIVGRTRVLATQIVLTLFAWATLSFQRLMHLDDYRHWADMGATLLAEIRRLRQAAGAADPDAVRLIMDRGGYKGAWFETLRDDPHASFIAMARATKPNVRQWEAIPERHFRPYHPAGEDNPNLKIARSITQIRGCQHPVPSIIIRDDTPDTKQPWRVLFYKDAPGTHPHAGMIDAEYRQRQHHEMGYAQYVHALAGHSLPKAYEMIREPNAQGQRRKTVATVESDQSHRDVLFVAWIKCLAFNLIHDFGAALGPLQAAQQVATLVRRYILRPGRLYLQAGQLIVQLDLFRGDDALRPYLQQLNARRLTIPWLHDLVLQVEIAAQPQGLAATPQVLGQRILASAAAAAPL